LFFIVDEQCRHSVTPRENGAAPQLTSSTAAKLGGKPRRHHRTNSTPNSLAVQWWACCA
jgi:hypothetical protein